MSAARKIRIFESEVQPVRIDELRINDDVFQSRAKTDVDMVKCYAERRQGKPSYPGTPFPPVLVFSIEGIWWLVDGFHRVAAAQKLGEETIPAVIRRGTTLDALLAGAAINMSKENLRGYQEEDRRRFLELLIRCGVGTEGAGSWDWSDGELARRTGRSAPFIASTRSRLALPGAIPAPVPIPEKVWHFRDGRKTGKRTLYRTAQSTGRPALGATKRGESSTEFRSQIGGKTTYLGSEEEAAKRELARRLAGRDAVRPALASNGSFIAWATRRGVPAGPVEPRESILGGIRVGDALALLLPAVDFDPVLREVGRAQLLRLVLPWCRRTVLVGYRDDGGGRAAHALALAARLPHPIEFLDPEEFVAEFGGVADAGEPASAQPPSGS